MEQNPYKSPDVVATGRPDNRSIENTIRWRRRAYRQLVGDAPSLLLILIVEIAVLIWVFGLFNG